MDLLGKEVPKKEIFKEEQNDPNGLSRKLVEFRIN